MRWSWLAFLLLVTPAWGQPAEAWKPAAGPLFTKWGRQVRPDQVHAEYPRPQMVRDHWVNLNGLWQYALAGKDRPDRWDGRILVPFPVESALSGVMKRVTGGQKLWYRRVFQAPARADAITLLHFGAVDWEAEVWVNGKPLGKHRGGYDPFTFDITAALQDQAEQELIVCVSDPTSDGPQPRGKQVNRPGGIYYTPTTGIWQTVWLESVPAAGYVSALRIDANPDRATVTVSLGLMTGGPGWLARATISDKGKVVASQTSNKLDLDLSLPRPKLWSPESPHLYDLKVELLVGGRPIDTVKSYFALRKVGVGKDGQGRTVLLLNDKPVFQVGLLDQGFWPDGLYTAPSDEALRFDIEQTKKLGYNLIRKHVKVEPARWYYWCDKLGLLVWQDMPSGDRSVAPGKPDLERSPESVKIYETELRAMINHLRPHPCIIMWVVFNEGWGQFDTRRITEATKGLDASRLVNCASGWNDHAGVGDVHDIHVYPGPGAPPLEEKRAIVLGEFGGLGLKIDGHTWEQRTWGYRGASDSADLTRKYERLMAQAWKLHREQGLSACIYTQTTDVETEANGIFTYDRAVLKLDEARLRAVNTGDISRIPVPVAIIPASEKAGQVYRYALEKPGDDWFKPGFDDSAWPQGPGGFGTRGTPGAVVRTQWNTSDIWLRRLVELPAEARLQNPHLWIHHDEDAEVYINGVLAAKVEGFTTGYEEVPISAEAAKTLRPGQNLIAVHCKQTRGGQYIDLGIVDLRK